MTEPRQPHAPSPRTRPDCHCQTTPRSSRASSRPRGLGPTAFLTSTDPTPRLTRGLPMVIAAACLLAAAYSFAVPAFEAPDEPGHYAYVEWLLDGHGIPLQGIEEMPWQPEISQPPLYYL